MARNTIAKGVIWKFLERFGCLGVQFVLQIVLGRILGPALYGELSFMIIFTTLANVFVQKGFNTALIQNKDVDEEDYSSVFWVSMAIALGFYIAIFAGAPFISDYFKMPHIVTPFRVLALMLFPGAFNSIQIAKISRHMDFKKLFFSHVGAILISGFLGVYIAVNGGGLWALVVQSLSNITITCIMMIFVVKVRIKRVCNMERIKVLFNFGWKVLVSSLIDTIYQDLRSLVIGRKYDSATLGYYNKGKHFPQFINNAVNGTLQSVMLPAMSTKQDDKAGLKMFMRNSIKASAYLITPIMAGLAATAEPLVVLLLTEKWLPCVPYLQIYCFTFAFYPVNTCNLQAINAMGRSDIFLKLEVIKKIYGIIALIIAVVFFDSPIAIALTGAITSVIGCFVNAFPNKKLIGYSYFEQMKDMVPSLISSLVMFACVLLIQLLNLPSMVTLIIQVITGIVVYAVISLVFKPVGYTMLKDMITNLLKKKKSASK